MEKPEILILGGSGFIGSKMAVYLVSLGLKGKLVMFSSVENQDPLLNQEMQFITGQVKREEIFSLIGRYRPALIFNLMGRVWASYPGDFYQSNLQAFVDLLEAVREEKGRTPTYQPRIIQMGSAAVYGEVENFPITEETPLNPVEHYGISKEAAARLVRLYFRKYQLQIVEARSFNVLGPGMPEKLSLSSFARQIALIEHGKKEPVLEAGNVSPKRDYLDVADLCEGLWLLSRQGRSGEVYQLCSARAYAIANLLEIMLNMAKVRIEVKISPPLQRAIDPPELRGSFDKINRETGWKPRIPIEESLKRLLDYWRNRLKNPGGSA